MKKYLVILSLFLLLCGCGTKSKEDIIGKFQKKIQKAESYILKGDMSIQSNEDTFTYDIVASKSKDDYYRVSLVNKTNNHEQVILKNEDGVYVVTPDLNKSFKFQSDWPNNGSQSYLIDVLSNDVSNDKKAYVGKDDKNNYIQCKVNYPNNSTLYSEKIYLDDDYGIKKVEILDKDGNVKITLNVRSINYKARFDDEYFALESLITPEDKDEELDSNNITTTKTTTKSTTSTTTKSDNTTTNSISTTTKPVVNNNDNKTTEESSNILEDIIYPLYVPKNTHLSTEDTINTDDGNRAILTFAGDSPFVLVEEVSKVYDELEIVPVNGDPLLMADCIGAISANSLYWSSAGIDYYISSTSLSGNELMTIAEGLSGSSVIVSAEK